MCSSDLLEVKGATISDGLGEISKGQNGELYFHPFNDDKSFMPNLPFEPVSIKPILKRDNNAIVDNIEIELEDDLPVASVPMEPIDVVKEDDDNQELSLDAISGTLDSDNELELEPKPIDGVKNENEDFGQEEGEELAEEVVDNSSSKKQVSKKTIYLSILVIGLIVIIFLIYLFRENFSVVLENLLYNKEELEILRKAGNL